MSFKTTNELTQLMRFAPETLVGLFEGYRQNFDNLEVSPLWKSIIFFMQPSSNKDNLAKQVYLLEKATKKEIILGNQIPQAIIDILEPPVLLLATLVNLLLEENVLNVNIDGDAMPLEIDEQYACYFVEQLLIHCSIIEGFSLLEQHYLDALLAINSIREYLKIVGIEVPLEVKNHQPTADQVADSQKVVQYLVETGRISGITEL